RSRPGTGRTSPAATPSGRPRLLEFPPDVVEETAYGRRRFPLYERPDQTLHEARHRSVRGNHLRETHLGATVPRTLEHHRAADVRVVVLDRDALEADPVDAVAFVARRVACHHAHRAGGALPGDEAERIGAHALAGREVGHTA